MIAGPISVVLLRWCIGSYFWSKLTSIAWVSLSGGFAKPIPMPAWVTERMEEKYVEPDDSPAPILPPDDGGVMPPDDARMLRELPPEARVPFFHQEHRNNIRTVMELLADEIDPPFFSPLVGPMQLHHSRWQCTIYYDEVLESGFPCFLSFGVRPSVACVYIDLDSLRPCAGAAKKACFADR